MSATYSLPEVAAEMRLDEQMKDPVRWLTKQIKLGRIGAKKYGRSYRMNRAQIEAAAGVETPPAIEDRPEARPARNGLSLASQRRRVA